MAGIKMNFNFAPMLEAVQAAGGNIDAAAAELAEQSGEIVAAELRAASAASGVAGISSGVRHKVERTGDKYTIKAGWDMTKGSDGNLSTGQLAAIFNYGTPERFVKKKNVHAQINGQFRMLSLSRGKVTGRGFIAKAKESAAPKVKKAQKAALKKMLAELEG